MPNENLKKHTLFLRQGDWDYLESVYYSSGISVSLIIRSLVANHVDGLKSQEDDAVNIKINMEE